GWLEEDDRAPIIPPKYLSPNTPSKPPSCSFAVSNLEVKALVAVEKKEDLFRDNKTIKRTIAAKNVLTKFFGFLKIQKSKKMIQVITEKNRDLLIEKGIAANKATEAQQSNRRLIFSGCNQK